jgi:F0F1-type ATP synthase membrane subunit b/b'
MSEPSDHEILQNALANLETAQRHGGEIRETALAIAKEQVATVIKRIEAEWDKD